MRRLTAVLLALALCGAGASLVVVGAPTIRHALRHTRIEPVAARIASLRWLAGLRALAPDAVSAAETLRFRPVPAESVARVTRRRVHAVTPAAPPAAEPPETPAAPEPSPAPEPPTVVKSGDVMRVGSDIHIARDEVVRGSVSAIGGDVTVDGHVEGDVSAIRGDVYLSPSARVDGDVVSAGGQIHEEPGAFVGGQRVTAMPGSRIRHLRRAVAGEARNGAGCIAGMMVWLIILLGVGWAIAQLAPTRTRAAIDTLQGAPLLSFGIGALILALIIPSIIALALVVAFLCITIIGIPLALAALLGYGLFFVVFGVWGYIVGVGAIGSVILQRRAAAAPIPGAVAVAPVPDGIARAVLTGVLVLTGAQFVGCVFGAPVMLAPLRFLGGFIFVIATIVVSMTTVAGGGAWVRSEFKTGTLGRWWHRRRAPSVPPPPARPAAPPPPPPPPPPSPPSAFAPPPADPQPPPTGG